MMRDGKMALEPPEGNETRLLTISELSTQSRLSVSQLRRLVKAGRIPFLQPGGPRGKLLFPSDALLKNAEPSKQASSTLPVRPKSGMKPKWKK